MRNNSLFEEWSLNYGFNPLMERYCRKMGIVAGDSRSAMVGMEACRAYCINQGVWFRNDGERVMFFDMFDISILPYDEPEDYMLYRGEIAYLREWCSHKGKTWRNYRYSEDAVCCLGKAEKGEGRKINCEGYDRYIIKGMVWDLAYKIRYSNRYGSGR